jgi:predicted DNA repair protein MutK
MLETLGTAMIASAIVILLVLMWLAYQPRSADATARPAVAETITLGLAGLLAIGIGLAEVGAMRSESESHQIIEIGRFAMVGGAFVLLWLWLRMGGDRARS